MNTASKTENSVKVGKKASELETLRNESKKNNAIIIELNDQLAKLKTASKTENSENVSKLEI